MFVSQKNVPQEELRDLTQVVELQSKAKQKCTNIRILQFQYLLVMLNSIDSFVFELPDL